MNMKWYFTTQGETIELRARMEGPGGLIGDAREEVGPGKDFFGLTYDALKKAGAGVVNVGGDGTGAIEPAAFGG
jgi:hypothetical protein